jgi:hypothetical protein
MLSIGLIPDRRYVDARISRVHDRLQLGDSLMKKAVTHAKTVFFEFHWIIYI